MNCLALHKSLLTLAAATMQVKLRSHCTIYVPSVFPIVVCSLKNSSRRTPRKRRADTKKEKPKRPIEGKTQAPYSPHLEGNTKLEDNPHGRHKLSSSCTNVITLPESTPFRQYTQNACLICTNETIKIQNC
jgi:hypothetical protein